jgi:acyl-CoA thioester hydrolase
MDSDINYRGVVYPWQCDHIGHMNVMWYVGKFDEANWNFFASVGLTPKYVRESGYGVAAVQQNLSYKRERLPGDLVQINTKILELRDKTVRYLHEMFNVEIGELRDDCRATQSQNPKGGAVVGGNPQRRDASPAVRRVAMKAICGRAIVPD